MIEEPSPARIVRPRIFALKAVLLAVTTAAFIPVLLSRSHIAGATYAIALAAVHVAGLAVLIVGIRDRTFNFSRKEMAIRLLAVAVLLSPLALLRPGLLAPPGWIFWGSLGTVWLLHTAGLALIHARGQGAANTLCPFL